MKRSNNPFQQPCTHGKLESDHQQSIENNVLKTILNEEIDNNCSIRIENVGDDEPDSFFYTPTSSQHDGISVDGYDDIDESSVDHPRNQHDGNMATKESFPLHVCAAEQCHMPLPGVVLSNGSATFQAIGCSANDFIDQVSVERIARSSDVNLDETIDVAMQFAATLLEFSWDNWDQRLEVSKEKTGKFSKENIYSKQVGTSESSITKQNHLKRAYNASRSYSSSSFSNAKVSEESSPSMTSTRSKPIKMKNKSPQSENLIAPNPKSTDVSANIPLSSLSVTDINKQMDYVDPRDGHIWRAKYCVLEGKCLFFYPHESVAMLEEAIIERQRWESNNHCTEGGLEDQKSISTVSLQVTRQGKDLSKKALLSQSPMPRRNFIHLGMTNNTTDYLDGNTPAISSSQFYEKVVPLECVGSVRSTEHDYGPNSFELSAVRDDDDDKLVLRSQNKEEMNQWLFQFHTAIASFVRDIMDQHLSTGDIHHHSFQHKSLLLPQLPLPTKAKVGTTGTPMTSTATLTIPSTAATASITINTPSTVESLTTSTMEASPIRSASSFSGAKFSPRYQKMLCGSNGSLSSSTTLALSHGHGRSAMHRRRGSCNSPSVPSSATSLIVAPTLDVTTSGKSVHDESMSVVQPLIPFPLSEHDSDVALGTPTPRNLDLQLEVALEAFRPPPRPFSTHGRCDTNVPAPLPDLRSNVNSKTHLNTNTAARKYIPPHMRNKNTSVEETTKKYVSPHLRARNVETTGIQETKENYEAHGALCLGPLSEPAYISRNLRSNDQVPVSDNMGCVRDLAESAFTSSQEKPGLITSDNDYETTFVMKMGGCADPLDRVGSILDKRYVSRTASKLEKVRAIPHGHISEQSLNDGTSSSLRWEIGAISECGIRETNQDSFLVTNNLVKMFEEPGTSDSNGSVESPQSNIWDFDGSVHPPGLFAIFDGHCGDHASRFAAERIASFIHFESLRETDDTAEIHVTKKIERILDNAIRNMDETFCKLCVEDEREWESGSTALVAALVNEHLIIANLGDSRGLVGRSVPEDHVTDHMEQGWELLPPEEYHDSGKKYLWKTVTNTHSPGEENERERITNANGWVTTEQEIPVCQLQRMVLFDDDVIDILKRCFTSQYCANETTAHAKASAPQRILQISRVCGELAVSRALGDRDFKASFHPQAENVVSPDSVLRNPAISDLIAWKSSMCLPYPSDHNGTFIGDLVSNVPDFQAVHIGQDYVYEEFLLLACDGLWDVMDADDAYRVSRDLLFKKKWSAKETAARLAELAVHLGSSDNITVIVVRFFHDSNDAKNESS